ncbi:MAG TPA: hypothetical protein PL143_00770 [Rhodocyclaceae bacterium]|nr:hypothetical protein [Rhodocyclaceae bacterium]
MTLHLELADLLEREFNGKLQGSIERKQDALIVPVADGVTLTVRYAGAAEYSLRWTHGGVEAGIDTAPLHHDLATFPNHLHCGDGRVVADPITDPARTPPDNLRRLVSALLDDPGRLESGQAE